MATLCFATGAIVGSWDRTNEFIYPYTVAETMDAGWCWQIDHEHSVNRGYVYSSRFLSDDEARAEFLRKNPKAIPWDHAIKFRSGRLSHSWVKNVIGLGNACGFVEPLEANRADGDRLTDPDDVRNAGTRAAAAVASDDRSVQSDFQ